MAEDGLRASAAAYVDADFRRVQDDVFSEHRRQEQRQLGFHKARLQSFARNRDVAEQRYVTRLNSIDERRDRIADRLQRQHNSIGGRLEALTKKGRARQAGQLERLEDRAAALKARATGQFENLKERQFEQEQRNRISYAHELKFFRLDHHDLRREQAKTHEAAREQKIGERVQAMRETAERTLKQELQRQQSHEREQGRGRAASR